MIQQALAAAVAGRSLDAESARAVMQSILAGEATPAQIGALAVALRMKGETVEEVAGLARAMRAAATPLPLSAAIARADLLDTCGTGGDGSHTVNLSTAVAFVAAGAGARVAKHGNRAVSSRAGSADVLEALGVRADLSPEACARSLEEVGIAFLFAPAFHGALRHAAGPRRELGLRTVFNVLGPLCNPAGAGRQLVGVFDDAWVPRLARVLGDLGAVRAAVVHSADGLDEISLEGPTRVAWLEEDGSVRQETVTPETFGLGSHPVAALRGGDAAHNAAVLRRVLDGEEGAALATVLANSAAALRVAGLAGDWREGVERARQAVTSGAARAKLDALLHFVVREVPAR